MTHSPKQTAWTPGPWAVHPHRALVVPLDHAHRPIGGSDDAAFDLATYAQEICALHWPDRNRLEQEVKANAHLIAAAPELYEALANLLDAVEDANNADDDVIVAANAALRAARPTQEGA